MTIAVDLGRKATKQTNKQIKVTIKTLCFVYLVERIFFCVVAKLVGISEFIMCNSPAVLMFFMSSLIQFYALNRFLIISFSGSA